MIIYLVINIYLSVCLCELNVVYQWDKINLSIVHETEHSYIPENNLVHRMKIWNNTLYMAIPRFKPGVLATLCKSNRGTIQPFPSLSLQIVGNCFGMQNIKDIEIDHLGNLWVLDVGKVYDLKEPNYTCDPKLLILDINTGRMIRSSVIPSSMYTTQSVLSGISIDLKTLTAVITDIGPNSGFIVYSYQLGIFQKFQCKLLSSVKDYNEALLTISPIDNILYFTTVEMDSLYTIPLSVFNAPFINDISHYVNNQGLKTDTSTAMIMDTTGNLYLGLTRKVIAWNTLKNSFDIKDLYIQEVRFDWISSFAFDSNGYLWITTSAFREFLNGSSSKRMNIKIFKRFCGTTAFALLHLQNTYVKNNTLPNNNSSANPKIATSIYLLTLIILLKNIS
ncbi:major royal jelly protein 1-like [Melanaphis sacchari]|uniref:Major royal jelly protein 1 n=1 Tax=Melanaphis sacchari TaxID=742174 RepID=A0A2H8TSD2_9HEMI|nr:major royal jelly protein 1-like [Melanaphis sacchari]